MKVIRILVALVLATQGSLAWAGEPDDAVADMQHAWAVANYTENEDEKATAFEQLLPRVDGYVEKHGKDAPVLIWSGIIKSTYAGVKGGLGALKYAKAARADLESALAIDPRALEGSAYTSLGTLYHKVPGWPIAFGDNKKAEQLLQTALSINPQGIDPNYFYGEYLLDNKRYAEAKRYLETAKAAPSRPNRPLADAGRQKEIADLLARADSKLK